MPRVQLPALPTLLILALVVGLAAPAARAHDERVAIGGKKLLIDTRGEPDSHRFVFLSEKNAGIRLGHDPQREPTALLIQSTGPHGASSGVIPLDPSRWQPILDAKQGQTGWLYSDPSGARGGVRRVHIERSRLSVIARGSNWPFRPAGPQENLSVRLKLEDEWFCADFDDPAYTAANDADYVLMRGAPPGSCPEQVCGNGVQELGEQCDDGDLEDGDGCSNSCTLNDCPDVEYATTFDAIQDIVFDGYGCTTGACHGPAMAGGLDLRAGASYEALVNVPSPLDPDVKRIVVPEPDESLLYQKLLAKTRGTAAPLGSPMPSGALPALTEAHLEAMYLWIRGGVPTDRVVAGTSDLLGTCLPPPTALNIPVPDPPAPQTGVQLQSTPWPLSADSEDEICMPIFYDFYQTGLVPDSAIVDCPERYQYDDCSNGDMTCTPSNALNPEGKCMAIRRQTAIQDPQSHHLILFMYGGRFGTDDPGWGEWTYKYQDQSHPNQGVPCDPEDIDPALGYNPNCSGVPESNLACISYGPEDYGDIANFAGGGSLLVSQEAYYDLTYPDGVYEVLPMRGVFVWNSHTFNLTPTDTTMSSYLNLEFAPPAQRVTPVREDFDIKDIFTQFVPPFETREYCSSWTIPKGGELFRLSSHTHKRGVLFRMWAPPNEPCRSACDPNNILCPILQGLLGDATLPVCTGPRDDQEIYYNTSYSDALNLLFDPPIAHDSEDPADRTYLYCAVYDNESGVDSPRVKRQSTSPQGPPPFGGFVGGPCTNAKVRCANDGPMKGGVCRGDDSLCDSAPGMGDGQCDACPVTGGVTSDDEMFALFGTWFCSQEECPRDGASGIGNLDP